MDWRAVVCRSQRVPSPGAAAGGVLRGLSVCYETVIPALFPFLVLSRLLLESAANALGLLLLPYTRLLGLHSTKAPAAMLCGVLGGFAGGAKGGGCSVPHRRVNCR